MNHLELDHPYAKKPEEQPEQASMRRCQTCFRPVKGHRALGPMGKACKLSPILTETDILNLKHAVREKHNEAARLGMATPANLQADKRRKATPASRKRKVEAERLRRNQRSHSNKAWYLPNSKIDVQKLQLPSMDCVCSSCGAKMFEFEFHRTQKDGSMMFSLCCGYGR